MIQEKVLDSMMVHGPGPLQLLEALRPYPIIFSREIIGHTNLLFDILGANHMHIKHGMILT